MSSNTEATDNNMTARVQLVRTIGQYDQSGSKLIK